jgi:hypothetical protein
MIKLLLVTQTTIDKLKRRIVKAWNGGNDTRTAVEASPYGVDSNPIKDMVALYVKSEVNGKESIVGYYNKQQLAEVGEARVYSTDSQGVFKFNIWLRADGKMLIGDSNNPSSYTNNAVQFNELKIEFNELKTKFNALVTAYNSHVHPYLNATTPAFTSPTTSQGMTSTANIDNAKNTKIKTN